MVPVLDTEPSMTERSPIVRERPAANATSDSLAPAGTLATNLAVRRAVRDSGFSC